MILKNVPTLLFPTSLPCTVLTWFSLFTLLTSIEYIVNNSQDYLLEYLLVKIALLGTFLAYAVCKAIHGVVIEENVEDSFDHENVDEYPDEGSRTYEKIIKLNHEKLLKYNIDEVYNENNFHVKELIELYEKLSEGEDYIKNGEI